MELPRERSGFCAGILAHLLITSFSAASVHFAKRCTILNQQGLKKITYRKIHTKPPPPPGTFGPTLIRGGCLKRCGNLMIFLPTKIHFKDFITIFLTNFHDIFVLFRGGCL